MKIFLSSLHPALNLMPVLHRLSFLYFVIIIMQRFSFWVQSWLFIQTLHLIPSIRSNRDTRSSNFKILWTVAKIPPSDKLVLNPRLQSDEVLLTVSLNQQMVITYSVKTTATLLSFKKILMNDPLSKKNSHQKLICCLQTSLWWSQWGE